VLVDFLLAAGAVGCGVYDAWFTKRRILKYGTEVELNEKIKQDALSGKLDLALAKQILLKTALPVLVGVYFHLTVPLAIYLGFKGAVVYFQLLSLQLEKFIESQ
jgi:hypothetical protein